MENLGRGSIGTGLRSACSRLRQRGTRDLRELGGKGVRPDEGQGVDDGDRDRSQQAIRSRRLGTHSRDAEAPETQRFQAELKSSTSYLGFPSFETERSS